MSFHSCYFQNASLNMKDIVSMLFQTQTIPLLLNTLSNNHEYIIYEKSSIDFISISFYFILILSQILQKSFLSTFSYFNIF